MIHPFNLRVYYEDTDFTGIVYYANYLRFAERGRSEYLRHIGLVHSELLKRDPPLAFIIKQMRMDFVKPAHVDDDLTVETRLDEVRAARFIMKQQIKRGDDLLWDAEVVAAIIHAQTAKPMRAPDVMAVLTQHIYKA